MGKNGLIYSFSSETKMLQNIYFVKVQCVKFLCHNMRQQYVVFFITIQLNHLELLLHNAIQQRNPARDVSVKIFDNGTGWK